jgi:hypothetical protein
MSRPLYFQLHLSPRTFPRLIFFSKKLVMSIKLDPEALGGAFWHWTMAPIHKKANSFMNVKLAM